MRQSRPQAENPYSILIRVEGRVDDQQYVWSDRQVLGQLQPIEEFSDVLVIQQRSLNSSTF